MPNFERTHEPMASRWSRVHLTVTYRDGEAEVASLGVSRSFGEKAVDSERLDDEDMVLDFNDRGELLGIEILSTELVTLEGVNRILAEQGIGPLTAMDLSPLLDPSQ